MNNSHPKVNECCPSRDSLARAAKGMAPEEEISQLEQHLDDCASCQELFDALLGFDEDLAELGAAMRGNTEADLESILSAGLPSFPGAQVDGDSVVLPGGLRLASPRKPCYQARLGDYDVLSVIGEGGMGIVLKAYDERLTREVALKVIGARWMHNATARERFRREAQAAARLQHPNVVTIYGVSEDRELPFIVMEFVRGKSLGFLIAEEGHLAPARAAAIARQVLAALEHAHREGIVHRDVKPENILLGAGADGAAVGSVKLVDFGLARGMTDTARHTAEGSVVGTAWYMSPEQAAGAPRIDLRSDLFSVGVVLFEMLTGVLPFPGQDLQHVLERIRTEAAPDPCQYNPDIPRPLAVIVNRALEKKPGNRYQSASEFAQALDEFLAGLEKATTPRAEMAPYSGLGLTPTPAGSTPHNEIWCAACGTRIFAPSSVPGRCEVCKQPICYKCWNAGQRRRCAQHVDRGTATPKPASEATREREPARPALVQQTVERSRELPLAEAGSAHVPPAAKSEPSAPSPATAAGPDKLPEARPSVEERLRAKHQQALEKIGQARAEGRLAASAYGAWLAEKSFLRMIESSLRLLNAVADPCRSVTVPVKNWSKVRREVTAASSPPACWMSFTSEHDELIRHPSSARVIFDLRKRNFLGMLYGRVVIEVCNLAHVERFVREGFDDQPVSRADLEVLLSDAVGRAVASKSWHVLILASPTGWTPEARDFVTGKGKLPFRDRLVSVVVFDGDTGCSLLDELDEKLWQIKEVFSADLDEATLAKARSFIDEFLMLKDSIGLDVLVGELGISQKAADRVFQILKSTGTYTVAMIPGMGQFLSKKN